MCAQSQFSFVELDGKLNTLTEQMDKLRIAWETLEGMPDTEDGLAKIQEQIKRLPEDLTEGITQVQSTLNQFQSMSATFNRVNASTNVVVQNVNDLRGLNESVIRIILPEDSLIWYGPEDKPTTRLWSLDHLDEQLPSPNAKYGGLDLSSVRLDYTYEDMTAKRHLADDVDEVVREYKRRRISDISPFIGITKPGNYFTNTCHR